jgi:hypothetical protein
MRDADEAGSDQSVPTVAPAEPARDSSLPLRTLIAAVLGAAAGVAGARALVGLLARIATPALADRIHSAALDAGLKALAGWNDPAAVRRGGLIALAVAGGAALLLPFLLNRRLVRRLLSLAGVLRALLGIGLAGALAMMVLALCDLFMATATAISAGRGFVFPGGGVREWGPFALRLALVAVGSAALYVVAGERATDRGARPGAGRGRAAAAAVGGVFAGTLVALLATWARPRLALLADPELVGALGRSAEPSALGWERLRLAVSVALGLLGGTMWALLVALAPSPAPARRRLLALLLAVTPAAALVLAGLWFQGHCRDARELRFPSLAAAAKLDPAPKPALLAVAGPRVLRYPLEAVARGALRDDSVGATRRNLGRLREYLEAQRGWTVWTARAWRAQPAILDRLLEPEEAVRAQLAAVEATGSLLETAALASRLERMPLTPAVRPVAERLLDPARFTARGEGKTHLAAIARNLGDLPRAERLAREAAAEGAAPSAAASQPASQPAAPDGAIGGRVLLAGAPVQGLRVVLYGARGPIDRVPLGLHLLAAATTDKEGRFSFARLPRASYALGLLLPASLGADPANVLVGGNLGLFDLARGAAQADAGTITLDRKDAAAARAATQPASAPASAAAPASRPAAGPASRPGR